MNLRKTHIFFMMGTLYLMLYGCKNDEITCTDANTSRVSKYDTIFVNTCRLVTATTPYSFLFHETQTNEVNYGKPLVRAIYTSISTKFLGDCEKGKTNYSSLVLEDFYLENVSDRNYTITCTLGSKTPDVVFLKAGEKKFIKNKIEKENYGFSLIDIEYE